MSYVCACCALLLTPFNIYSIAPDECMCETTAYARRLVSMRRANYESRRGCVILMVLSLQAFGLAVLMARAGLAVPAEAPVQVPAYSAVLADIGDEQSLSANLSTFSGHLRRIQVKPLLLFSHPCTFFCFVCCSLCRSSSQA